MEVEGGLAVLNRRIFFQKGSHTRDGKGPLEILTGWVLTPEAKILFQSLIIQKSG